MDKPADIAVVNSGIGENEEIVMNTAYQLLNNVLKEKIEQNKVETNKWTDYKNSHEKIIKGLQEFPLSVSENCMVPIGKLAFMKGKLIHTNEILVCLGDGYFAKYSASQAIALCNRRISFADDTLKRLEAEKNLYEMRQILPVEDLFGKQEQDKKNIFEHWNEEKVNEWRMQHREREKEYRKKLAELREMEKTNISTEEDLFKRLDELELEEELEDEMSRLEIERQRFYGDDLEGGEIYDESEEDDDSSDSNEITVEMLQNELKELKDIHKNKVTNDTSNVSNSYDTSQDKTANINSIKSEQSDHTIDSIQKELKESCSPESENISTNINIERKKRVSFMELCNQNNADEQISTDESSMSHFIEQDNICNESDDTVKIEFSPSSYIPNISESNNMEIQSPADIYKMFDKSIKPILKRSPNDMVPHQVMPLSHEDSSSDTENECYGTKASTYTCVMKDILEKKTAISLNNTVEKKNGKKTMSRFKMERVANAK